MKKIFFLATLALLSARALFAEEFRCVVDGSFDDWESVPVLYSKPATGSGLEIVEMKYITDSRFLYIYFELSKEINLNNSNISLNFDTDFNSTTGEGALGADLTWNFSNLSGKHIVSGATNDLKHYHLNLVAMPTYSSKQFELAIERNVAVKGKILFPGTTTNFWVTVGAEQVPKDGPVVIQLQGESMYASGSTIDRNPEASFRIASINAKMDNIFKPTGQAAFGKLIGALQPDVLAIEEIYDHTAKETSDLVSTFYPNGSPNMFSYFKAQPDIVLLSRYPILDWENVGGNGAFLLNTSAQFGVNTVVIAAHLPAADKDSERTAEADKLAKAISDMRAGNFKFKIGNNTPIIMLGDFNLVGSSTPYYALRDGKLSTGESLPPDVGQKSLAEARLTQLFLPITYTWRSVESDFPPADLDRVFYTSSSLELKNSLALFTEELPSEYLSQFGLEYGTSSDASDHLPIVADFKVNNLSAGETVPLEAIYPNPASDFIYTPEGSVESFRIYGATGTLAKEGTPVGNRIDVRELPAGLYILRAKIGSVTRFYKFVKQ